MTDVMRTLEGGPFDGVRVGVDADIIRMPLPHPVKAYVSDTIPTPTLDFVEYERAGPVYRHPTLIRDAHAVMHVSAEAFRDAAVRREARRMVRRELDRIANGKVVDRIVWVLARDVRTFTFTLVGVVGGRRADHAAHFRRDLRSGFPASV